jgi:ketosteroid isomerase-like protein
MISEPLPTQTNELLVRELFTALNDHDLASLQIVLSPAAVLHVPGHNPNASDYYGHTGFLEFWSKQSQRVAGRVDIKVDDVLANTRSAAVLALGVAERKGEKLENRVVYVLRLEAEPRSTHSQILLGNERKRKCLPLCNQIVSVCCFSVVATSLPFKITAFLMG